MAENSRNEPLVEQKVTYTLQKNGQLIVVENVPARVNLETGEQLFAPETVERLQRMIWEQKEPTRVMQVPVYEFA
jgi:YgiT-type zinc finger domain-containing protein